MQIIKNALSEELYNALVEELKSQLHNQVWGSSRILWPEELKKGIYGTTLTCKVSDVLSNQILRELKDYVPNVSRTVCQFYVWQHNAGISKHDDDNHMFGATIYLNETWDLNDGGFFIWTDKDTNQLKVLSPEKNMMVLNLNAEYHLVTPVLPSAQDFRYTIQIWGN